MTGEEAGKRKRPMGLKARAAKKTSAGPAVRDFEDSTATVVLQGDEGSNELDELEGIFDSAIASADEDPERALALLRGTIHESDRMLRARDAAAAADDDQPPLEARFYLVYGSALFALAELDEAAEGDRPALLEAARERLEQARALCEDRDRPLLWRVHLALAKAELEILAVDEAAAVPLPSLDRAMQSLEAASSSEGPLPQREEPLAVVDLVLSLADSQRVGPRVAAELAAWGADQARRLPGAEARHMLGRALWVRASALTDKAEAEEEEEDDDNEDETTTTEPVRTLLAEAAELLADAEDSDTLLLRGEVEINLGNALDGDADAQERAYAAAVATFRRVQAMGALPEQFAEYIDAFENPASDDDGGDDVVEEE
ncbi:hypothetical protein H4R18_001904 [Coemansia javaensis]|uniref:Uncharacterized protein n=1 Tax=Coemansia javaensis TaxID=2761396 RepID=A0A9W8HCD3_9FUNG|nr:hypothetical protein H4R18_001904 [Coemansia javaensis]